MTENKAILNQPDHWHGQTSEKAVSMTDDQKALSPEETRRMLHEQRVQQMELKTQNAELRRKLADLASARVLNEQRMQVLLQQNQMTASTLRESEKKYRLIAENTADLISIMDMNLNFTYVSPGIMRLRGLTAQSARAPPSISICR
jgi:PAS domain-containing protein